MKYGLWVGALLAVTASFGQGKKTAWGYLRDSTTHAPVPLASVTNLKTRQTVMTSESGRFQIALAENQVLSFAAVGYHFDTLQYARQWLTQDTLLLFLSPLSHDLGNVTVFSNRYSRYQLDSMERRKDFLQGFVNYTIPAIAQANSGAGIALNIDRFSRHERAKRRAFAIFDAAEKEAYIDYRFPASFVTQYSRLKGEQLQLFMQNYRPDATWLRKHLDEEDLILYLNDKLKLYKQNAATRSGAPQ